MFGGNACSVIDQVNEVITFFLQVKRLSVFEEASTVSTQWKHNTTNGNTRVMLVSTESCLRCSVESLCVIDAWYFIVYLFKC